MTEDRYGRQSSANGAPWSGAMEIQTFAFPVAFALIACGMTGFFGKVGIVSLVLLVLCAIAFQLANNVARLYGDGADRHFVENEYYERKFEQYRRAGKGIDPLTGTAGDIQEMQLKMMLVASTVFAVVLGYGFVLSCTGATAWSLNSLSLTCLILFAVLLLLRYLSGWSWGYRTYGNAVLFVLMAAATLGCFYIMVGAFVLAAVYPSLGVGALAVAAGNMRDIAYEEHDAEMEQTTRPRCTVPLMTGIRGAVVLQVVSEVFAMAWVLAFPLALGATHVWNYAFVLFFVPMVIEIFMLPKARPSDIPGSRKSLAASMALVGVAFFFGMSAANLGTMLLAMV